jgi:hypothetical protein
VSHRPHFRPDHSRQGYVWAYGALAHRSGCALVDTAERRDTASWLRFLDRLEGFVPPGDGYLILDGLVLHGGIETMLRNWGHPRFHFVPLPKRAAWLNLIEGFWKILTQRAVPGRRCRSAGGVTAALTAAAADWNAQPTPFLGGRPPRPRRRLKRTYVFRIGGTAHLEPVRDSAEAEDRTGTVKLEAGEGDEMQRSHGARPGSASGMSWGPSMRTPASPGCSPTHGQPAEAPWRLALVTSCNSRRGCRTARQPRPSAPGSIGSTPWAWP